MANWTIDIDTGSGYINFPNAILNNCKYKIVQESDFSFYRTKIDGTIIFIGDDYTTISNLREANDYLLANIKKGIYINETIHLFLDGEWDETTRICKLKCEVQDEYSKIIESKSKEYNFLSWGLTENTITDDAGHTWTRAILFHDVVSRLFYEITGINYHIRWYTPLGSSVIESISDFILDGGVEKTNPATICYITLDKINNIFRDYFRVNWIIVNETEIIIYPNGLIYDEIGENNNSISIWQPYNKYNIEKLNVTHTVKRDIIAQLPQFIGQDIVYDNGSTDIKTLGLKDFFFDVNGTLICPNEYPGDSTNQYMLINVDLEATQPIFQDDTPVELPEGYTKFEFYQIYGGLSGDRYCHVSDTRIGKHIIFIGIDLQLITPNPSILSFTVSTLVNKIKLYWGKYVDGVLTKLIDIGTLIDTGQYSFFYNDYDFQSEQPYVIIECDGIGEFKIEHGLLNFANNNGFPTPWLINQGIEVPNDKFSLFQLDKKINSYYWDYKRATIEWQYYSDLKVRNKKELQIEFPLTDISKLNPYKTIDIGLSTEADIVEFEQNISNYNDKVRMKVRY